MSLNTVEKKLWSYHWVSTYWFKMSSFRPEMIKKFVSRFITDIQLSHNR